MRGYVPPGGGASSSRQQVAQYFDDQATDYRVPSWDGTGGAVALPIFEKKAEAYVRAQKSEDQPRAVLQIWSNLRGQAADACRNLTVDQLLTVIGEDRPGVGGFTQMIDSLKKRWPEGPLRRLPRLYKALFSDVRYRQGDDIVDALSALEQAQRELEVADPDAKVSAGIMGYLALQLLQLSDQEVVHVLGLTTFSMKYDAIRAVLLELYPRGSHSALREQRGRWPRHEHGAHWSGREQPESDGTKAGTKNMMMVQVRALGGTTGATTKIQTTRRKKPKSG